MKCPECGSLEFEPMLTFGYVCSGYLSFVRCKNCGNQINVEKSVGGKDIEKTA